MASPSEIAALEIRITGVEKAIAQFSNFQQTTTKTMSASEAAVTRSLKNMVSQFVGVAAAARAVQNVVSSGVGFNQFVENTTTSFTVMMKSAEKAQQQMKDLYNFAVNSPLTFKETAASSKQLMAYGFAAEELIPTMKTLGTVAIATGHSLDDISYVYGTLKSQGRAYSRDLMQFGMRGIPIYEELAKVLNVDVSAIQKMASEGKIGFAEVEKAFQNMTTNGGRFAGTIEGYMTTLTGKLSMLGDIAQQSAGTLMSGVTAQLKILVTDLTKSLSSPEMQLFIKNLASDLTNIASILRVLITFVVDNIGTITTALKIWMASKLFNGAIKALNIDLVSVFATAKDLLAVFRGLGAGGVATVFSAAINSTNTAIGKLFAQIASGISLVLSPLGVLVAAIASITVALNAQNDAWKKSAISAKSATDDTVRMAQFMKDYSSQSEKAHGSLLQYIKNIVGLNKELTSVNPANVTKLADEYNLSTQAVADALIYQGLLTQEAWKTYQAVNATKNAQAGTKQSMTAKDYVNTSPMASTLQAVGLSTDKLAEDALRAIGVGDLIDDFESGVQSAIETAFKAVATIGEPSLKKKEQDILANLTASGASTDFVANLAGLGVNSDVLESQTKAALTKRVGLLTQYTTDLLARDAEVKKTYTDQINVLVAQGLSTEDAKKQLGELDQNPQLLAWLARQLNAAQLQLDGLGKKTKAVKQELLPILSTWWTPMVQSAKATLDPIDDINIATLQSLESVDKEYANQIAILDKQANILAAEGGNEIELNQIAVQRIELFNTLLGLHRDITAEGEKQKNLRLYETATEGNSAVMDQWKASAGAAYAQGGIAGTATGATLQGTSQMLSGTQAGSMATGGNPVAVAMTALVDFAKSIQNVNALLNPFSTMFEAMRTTLEPIINNVLQPMVDVLQMVGEALAPIISVIIVSLKPAIDIFYTSLAPVIGALQILSEGFRQFYNNVIVNIANAIVDIMNAVIYALNKLPFVEIKYIDSLKKMALATTNYTAALNNQKTSLSNTISYLIEKINAPIEKQISSYQSLYEVGAITAATYEKQIAALNAQKLDESTALISVADKQLTASGDIYKRLYKLYDLQEYLEKHPNLTAEQQSKLLADNGITSQSAAKAMQNNIVAALKAYYGSDPNTTGADPNTTGADTSAADAERSAALITDLYNKYINDRREEDVSAVSSLSDSEARAYLTKISDYYKQFSYVTYDGYANAYDQIMGQAKSSGKTIQEMLQIYANFAESPLTFAVGTGNVPYDMTAQIHKGEGIIPATFMDSIRSGELALSSGQSNEGSGQTTIIQVNVSGSVTTENELAETIANVIYTQRSRGILTI